MVQSPPRFLELTQPLDLPYAHLLQCPGCSGSFEAPSRQRLRCTRCGKAYPISQGLPLLFEPHQEVGRHLAASNRIREFYEANPFPDYDDFDSLGSLLEKARRGVFARLLDQEIPFGARVLECGCGTGQLSCFLGIAHRTVFGTDLSVSSLSLAEDFRRRHDLQRVFFLQMNLFCPVFPPKTFDVVICNGVLHHTGDAYAGFQVLSRLVKPGGFLIVGLYHRYGRLATDLRRAFYRIAGERWTGLDPRLRRQGISRAKRKAWFNDQYRNPHETKFTISQTLDWLPPNGLQLVKSIPKTRLFSKFSSEEPLFQDELPGGWLGRSLVELGQTFGGASEGGFFTLIARKEGKAA